MKQSLKPSLLLRQTQHLSMTQELRQAIRLLRLSGDELEQVIQTELEQNPLLECESSYLSPENQEINQDLNHTVNLDLSHDINREMNQDLNQDVRHEIRHDISQQINQDILHNTKQNEESKFHEVYHKLQDSSLCQHLLFQLDMLSLTPEEKQIGIYLIDAIDENGYLDLSLIEIQENLASNEALRVSLDEIQKVLQQIQQFDPLGVGATSLSECLYIQLCSLPEETPWLEQTKRIVVNYLELLGKRDYFKVSEFLNLNHETLNEVLKLLKKLDPKPGSRFFAKTADPIVPDVIVSNRQNRLVVDLNMSSLPKLRVNMDYANLIKNQSSKQDVMTLHQYVNEAQWFLKGIQTRQDTLLKVASEIVEKQKSFFEKGEEALKPLILQDIAKATGLHESTISRITHQKYMSTPKGIFELKFFFSNASNKSISDDSLVSSVSVRAFIKKMVAEESKMDPLSDHQIVEALSKKGIQIARRTVSKYRIALKIPASYLRRQVGRGQEINQQLKE